MKYETLGILSILTVLLIMLVINWYVYLDEPKEKEIVKCYDRYGNEIVGVDCIKDNDDISMPLIITFLSIIVIALILSITNFMDNIRGYH